MKNMFVYILTNERRTTLYIGVTNDLERRLLQHRDGTVAFTRRYNLTVLIHYESSFEPAAAITREKQLKGWSRAKKEALISTTNPDWRDLAADWFQDSRPSAPAPRPSPNPPPQNCRHPERSEESAGNETQSKDPVGPETPNAPQHRPGSFDSAPAHLRPPRRSAQDDTDFGK